METPEMIWTSLQTGEWVTSIDFKDAYFHIPIQNRSRKYLRFHVEGKTYQFKALLFGLSTAPLEFTVVAKEIKLMALQQGIRIHQYLDDWLVRATSRQICLNHTRALVSLCQDLGWVVILEKSELEPKQVFDFVGYQFDLQEGKVRPTSDRWVALKTKIRFTGKKYLSGSALDVPYRTVNSYRKTGPPRQASYETHTMASQKQLEGPRITTEGDTSPQVASLSPKVVDGGEQCAPRSTSSPIKTSSADIYRRIKRRVGRSLKRHCKRNLVTSRNQTSYKLSGVKGSLSSLKRIPAFLFRPNGTGSNGQHNSGILHKQERRHEVGSTVCPTMENIDLVYQKPSNSQSPTHSRSAECGGRLGQTIQKSGLSFQRSSEQYATGRSFCNEVQPQVASVCVSSTRPPGYSSGHTQPNMGGSGCICLSTSIHLGQSGGEASGLPIQECHPDRSRVAQHALVLGSSGDVSSNSLEPSPPTKSVNSAL